VDITATNGSLLHFRPGWASLAEHANTLEILR
jgi:hypothetical protein